MVKTVYYVGEGYQVGGEPTENLVAESYSAARDLLEFYGVIDQLVLDPDMVHALKLAESLRGKEMGPENTHILINLLTTKVPDQYKNLRNVVPVEPNQLGKGFLSDIVRKESGPSPK